MDEQSKPYYTVASSLCKGTTLATCRASIG
ncbi:MAG: hypothetical protein FD153_467, partial [Rhodospirillaceae bacterium]